MPYRILSHAGNAGKEVHRLAESASDGLPVQPVEVARPGVVVNVVDDLLFNHGAVVASMEKLLGFLNGL